MADAKTATDVADHALAQIDKFGNLLSTLAQKLSEVAMQHAPQAWEMAKEVMVVNCLSTLIYALVGAIVYAVLTAINIKQCAKRIWYNNDVDDENKFWGTVLFLCLPQAVLLVTCFAGLQAFMLFDAWTWIGLWHPELVIAKTLLHL